MKFLILTLLLTSCGLGANKPEPHSNDLSGLDVIEQEILTQLPESQDEHGWIDSDRCDALLYTGILHCLVDSVDILAGKDLETGQWYRTPTKDCYRNYKSQRDSTRKSKSTVSRDGFTGLAWSLSCDALLGKQEASAILDYGRRNRWVMGEGLKTRTIFSPNLQRTYAMLAGEKQPLLPDLWLLSDSYSERHIAILHILLRGKLKGKLSDEMLSSVNEAYRDQPRNALFSYAFHLYNKGDQSHTIQLIKDLYPNTSCKTWLWNHPEPGWVDCGRKNSNVEFLFVIKLLRDNQHVDLK